MHAFGEGKGMLQFVYMPRDSMVTVCIRQVMTSACSQISVWSFTGFSLMVMLYG